MLCSLTATILVYISHKNTNKITQNKQITHVDDIRFFQILHSEIFMSYSNIKYTKHTFTNLQSPGITSENKQIHTNCNASCTVHSPLSNVYTIYKQNKIKILYLHSYTVYTLYIHHNTTQRKAEISDNFSFFF